MSQETDNKMERRAIPDLLNQRYFIPAYQRGYRWEEKQVLDLLGDLYSYFDDKTTGQFYCLQPIVVKQIEYKGETWYEVIDGQQRLTTLRLLMQVFDQLNRSAFGPLITHGYTICYATRPEMQNIFESVSVTNDTQGNAVIDDTKNEWKDFIDSYYIYNAAKTILGWFMGTPSRINVFAQYLYNPIDSAKSVQVVWYETVEDKEPHDIFNRMNSLKVGLSCSELIRSLFLSSGAKFNLGDVSQFSESVQYEIRHERFGTKQTSINEKWDEIEQRMRDNEFQSFLTRRKDTGRNAIGLLFDLMSGKYASNKVQCPYPKLHKDDEQYTYLYFKEMMDADGDAWITWEKVLNAFEKLQYWYKDRDLYHRIGFLNAVADKQHSDDAICRLLTFRNGKRALHDNAVALVKETMNLPEDETKTKIDSLEKLSYDNPTHNEYIQKLLLLYNVETSRNLTSDDFFSFNRFRYELDGKTERLWTLEHIHAQNSDCLDKNDKNSWNEWIRCNLDSLQKLSLGDPNLIGAQNDIIKLLERDSAIQADSNEPICKSKNYTFDNIRALFDSVLAFYAKLDAKADNAKPVHQLSNMALLEQGKNAMVGKSPFEVKRQRISNDIADNRYYPICTRKVFLKLYDKESLQIHSWSQRDRELYYNDIKNKLGLYIDESAF